MPQADADLSYLMEYLIILFSTQVTFGGAFRRLSALLCSACDRVVAFKSIRFHIFIILELLDT